MPATPAGFRVITPADAGNERMRADEPHPDVQQLLAQVEAADVLPLAQYDADTARAVSAEMRADAEGPKLGDVEDRTVPGPDGEIPVRIYRPEGEGPFPTVVHFHGGGWVIGDLESHDLLCRHLADRSGCVVVAVHYRRAPEHPYPAAFEDAYAATEWVAANQQAVDGTGRIGVTGDSAGGNLAAAVARVGRGSVADPNEEQPSAGETAIYEEDSAETQSDTRIYRAENADEDPEQ